MEKIRNLLNRLKIYIMYILGAIGFNILILSDKENPLDERVYSFIKLVIISGPVAFVLKLMGSWFTDNKEFSTYVIACILLNMLLGIIRHFKKFSWIELLKKTGLMFLVLVVVYGGLEMMLKIARDNVITEVFRLALQVSTLMYPLSKVFKNTFILTKGEYPPQWVMEKFYKFHNDGDLTDLFKIKDKKEN